MAVSLRLRGERIGEDEVKTNKKRFRLSSGSRGSNAQKDSFFYDGIFYFIFQSLGHDGLSFSQPSQHVRTLTHKGQG